MSCLDNCSKVKISVPTMDQRIRPFFNQSWNSESSFDYIYILVITPIRIVVVYLELTAFCFLLRYMFDSLYSLQYETPFNRICLVRQPSRTRTNGLGDYQHL